MGSYVSTIGAINDLYNVHMSTNRFENQKHGIELSGLVLVEVLLGKLEDSLSYKFPICVRFIYKRLGNL